MSGPADPHIDTLVYEGLQCPACGHDLRGVSDLRCPECGGAVDPAELESQRGWRPFRRKIRRDGNGILTAGLVAGFCEAQLETGNLFVAAYFASFGPLLGLFMILAFPWLGVPWLWGVPAVIAIGLRRREYWPLAILGYVAAAATWVFSVFIGLGKISLPWWR
jgi:hypothetical protein